MPYDIYCDFDIEKHKQTYIDYLEVLILRDGTVVYAVPSHQAKAEQLCCEQLNVTHDELIYKCPTEYYCDYMTWLLTKCGAIAVWNRFYKAGEFGINNRQRTTLRKLKLHGLYKGTMYAS